MALLDDVGAALTTAGLVGGATGWTLYLGHLFDEPDKDKAVCLYELPGEVPEQKWAIDRPALQVRVRGAANGYSAARAKLQAIFDLLHAGEDAVGGGMVFLYAAQSGPTPLGADEKFRPHISMRFFSLRNRT